MVLPGMTVCIAARSRSFNRGREADHDREGMDGALVDSAFSCLASPRLPPKPRTASCDGTGVRTMLARKGGHALV